MTIAMIIFMVAFAYFWVQKQLEKASFTYHYDEEGNELVKHSEDILYKGYRSD